MALNNMWAHFQSKSVFFKYLFGTATATTTGCLLWQDPKKPDCNHKTGFFFPFFIFIFIFSG